MYAIGVYASADYKTAASTDPNGPKALSLLCESILYCSILYSSIPYYTILYTIIHHMMLSCIIV